MDNWNQHEYTKRNGWEDTSYSSGTGNETISPIQDTKDPQLLNNIPPLAPEQLSFLLWFIRTSTDNELNTVYGSDDLEEIVKTHKSDRMLYELLMNHTRKEYAKARKEYEKASERAHNNIV